MDALTEIKGMVDRIVGEVLESRLAEIRHEVLGRVEDELQPLLVQQEGAAALLNVAVNNIQGSLSQADILRGVLDGATNFSGRAILFVVRSGQATPWHARGMNEAELKGKSLDIEDGPAAEVIDTREAQPVKAKLANISPTAGALLLPLTVRDKVAALLYADAGSSGPPTDRHALDLLLRSAGLWLEIAASRRNAQAAGEAEPRPQKPASGAGASRTAEGMVTPAERVEHSAVPTDEAPRPEPPIVPAERVAESASSLAGVEAPKPALDDEETHARARRFARLLVDEIKLYNEEKVVEGREHRDLYARLKEDIDKSRAAYDRRYGQSAAASSNYFQQELVRILAQGDAALLGDRN
jgi:hypothetical protein